MLLWAALAEVEEEAVEPGIQVLAVELDTQAVAVVRYDTQAAAVEERDTPAVAVVEHDTRAPAVAVAEHDTRASAGAERCTQAAAAAEEEEEELVASYLVAAPCTLSADGGHYHQRFHHFPNSSWSCSLLVTCPEPMLSRQRPAPGLTHPRPLRRLLSGAAIA